jgi:hypothetical protein
MNIPDANNSLEIEVGVHSKTNFSGDLIGGKF